MLASFIARLSLCITLLAGTGCETAKAKVFEAAMQKQRSDTGFVLQHTQLGDFTWAYLDQGEGPETVLLVHGFSANKDSWLSPAIDPLRTRYRILAPDLPGFGDSTYLPAADYSFSAQAERLVAFLDKVEVEKAHVIGASMGGGVTVALAAAHPERVLSATVLTAAGVDGKEQSEYFQALARGEPNTLLIKTEADLDRMFPMVFENPPEVPAAAKPFVVAELAKRYDQHAAIFEQLVAKPEPLNGRLSQITVPMLVLWGDGDRILHPSAAEVFRTELPSAKVVIIPRCGHAIQGDRPHQAATEIMQFLLALEDQNASGEQR